jgi:hypothetical protein
MREALRARLRNCGARCPNWQSAGLIHYSRGRITVVDRSGVEARVCECYAVVKAESDRLLAYVKAA